MDMPGPLRILAGSGNTMAGLLDAAGCRAPYPAPMQFPMTNGRWRFGSASTLPRGIWARFGGLARGCRPVAGTVP